jgi:NADH-quinone oxidoreductase subunit M
MNLSLLILLPLLTALAVLVVKKPSLVRIISFIGSVLQLGLAIFLYVAYSQERANGNFDTMLFTEQWSIFPSMRISFHLLMEFL